MKLNVKNHRCYYDAEKRIVSNGYWAVWLGRIDPKMPVKYDDPQMAGLIMAGKSFMMVVGPNFGAKMPDWDAISTIPAGAVEITATKEAHIRTTMPLTYAHKFEGGDIQVWLQAPHAAILDELGHSKLLATSPDNAVFAVSCDGDIMGIFMPMKV